MSSLAARLRRLLLTGLALTPPAAAAVWAWWQRGVPRTPGDAATWTARHEGLLDATGLHASECEASLRRLKEKR